MAIEVLMPVITAEGDDGVVTAWMVDDGSTVSAGQLIAEVQAEKVAEEVHAPADGVVRDLVPINEPVPQGRPICLLVDEADQPSGVSVSSAAPSRATVGVAASPAARRLARELGIDLQTVTGSGPGGRITEADVQAATPAASLPGRELGGLRAVIARNMRESMRTTAPVTLTTTVNLTSAPSDHITARVVRAAARALVEHPDLNGRRDGDRFIPGEGVNIALAIQTEDGLTAPVIRDAGGRAVEELAAEIRSLADRARTRELTSADFADGTFSVTNLGSYGIDAFTPIINPPQVAILGVGALRTVPGYNPGGELEEQRHSVLSLTFDHSFVDGAPAAAFLESVRRLLEEG